MANFERGFDSSPQTESLIKKFSLRLMEPSVKKFIKVIEIDLSRLDKHRKNVEKYNRIMDWPNLHTEQINATRTVQQIIANVREIEKARLQVMDDDVAAFDEKIDRMKQTALQSVKDFVDVTSQAIQKNDSSSPSTNGTPKFDLSPLSLDQGQGHSEGHNKGLIEGQLLVIERPENTAVAESWDQLQENLEELNVLIHQFANAVDDQQEQINTIEANVDKAHSSISDGVKQLGKAAGYKAAILPFAGAALGTIVAGPAGLLVGAKLGAVIGALGGGAAGFLGGNFVKKHQEKVTEIELSNLSQKRTNSLPDISSPEAATSWFQWSRKRVQSQSECETLPILPDSHQPK